MAGMSDGGYSVVSKLFCLLFSRDVSVCQFSNVIKLIVLSFFLIAGLSVGAQAATVITEDFEGTVTGWNNNSIYNGGTSYTKIHGLHTGGYIGQSATQQVYKTFTIPNNTTEVQIEFDFLKVGFWFSKQFKLYVNDQQSAVGTFNYSSGDSSSSSTSLGSGTMGSYQVSKHRFNVTVPVSSGETTLKVGFGSDGHEDTSWGAFAYWAVDNLKLTAETSEATGSLIVEKSVSGAGNTFAYTTTGTGLSGFTLSPSTDGTANQTFSGLTAGSYTITETALSGYDFASLTCTGDTDNGNIVDVANRRVTIDLDAGETQTCTFASTEQTGGGSGGTGGGGSGGVDGEVVGTTSAKFGVTPGGAASYSIPIAMPKGTADMQPKLALQYNSRDRNSIMGVGWKITGLSYINRCATNLYVDDPEKGGVGIDPVDYDDNDKFCLNGERLMAVKGIYGADGTEYRTFFEEFSKVISHGSSATGPTSFTVYKKTGEILTYGGTTASRFQRNTEDHVWTWALSKLADAKGNYISYSYHNDRPNGEFYINRIDYTGNDAQGLAPYNHVSFLYEDRDDKINHYKAGDKITLTKRLNKIQVFTESQLAHEYRIAYGAGDTERSRVSSITECANVTTCFKPTVFEWNDGKVGPKQSSFQLIDNDYDPDYYGTETFLDFNGDGLPDVMHRTTGAPGCAPDHKIFSVLVNRGDGNFRPTRSSDIKRISECWEIVKIGDFNGDGKSDFYSGRVDGYVHLSNGDGTFQRYKIDPNYHSIVRAVGDFNGDGMDDLYMAPSDSRNSMPQYVLLSNGDGTFEVKSLAAAQKIPYPYTVAAQGDFNGDGRTDLYLYDLKYASGNGNKNGRKIGSANDLVFLAEADGTFHKITLPSSDDLSGEHKIYGQGDFNGDGLTDLYSAKPYNSLYEGKYAKDSENVWLSKGDGTFKKVSVSNIHGNLNAIFVAPDMNGDGLSDLLVTHFSEYNEDHHAATERKIYLANGDGTFRQSSVELFTGLVMASTNRKGHVFNISDFNGDGLNDFATMGAHQDFRDEYHYIPKVHLSTFLPPEKITSITNGHGLNTKVYYKPLTDNTVYTKGTTAQYPVQDAINARSVVSKVDADNGIGTQNSQTYIYEGLQYHLRGLRNLGFRKMLMTDVRTGIKTETIYNQDWENHHQGLLKSSKTIAPDNTVMNERTLSWKVRGFTDENEVFASCFRYADETVLTKRDLNGTFISRETEKTTFDNLGFRTRIEMITENENGSQTFSKVADNTFTHNLDTWRLGQLTQSVVTQSKIPSAGPLDTVVNTTTFTYDTDGYLLSTTKEPGNALEHTATNTLNAYGGIESVTETWSSTETDGVAATSRTTSFEFDPKVRFITKETNPLGHTETKTYHPILGTVASTTGPNGLTTSFDHDAFGRVIKETKADGTTTDSAMEFCSTEVPCPTGAVYRQRSVKSDGSEKLVYMNKLNLEIKMSALLDNRWTHAVTEYDEIGREKRKTQPHFDGETLHWTTNTYDILDRKTRVDRPDGSFQTATFNGLTQVSTNELGQTKTVTKNVIEKDAAITNHEGHTITYTYDGAGQLLTMTANGEITSYAYDLRGNKISDSDPDKGTWTYRYNALGKIVAQTNSKGEITRMSYDVLDRMLTRTDNSDQAGSQDRITRWYYDTAANGIGKLYRTTRSNGYELINSYDTLGRPITTQETIDGENFTTSTTYDSQSRPDTTSYPSGVVTKNTYDAQGTLLKVANNNSAETWWERLEVDARGNVTKARHGNGVETMRTFDPTTGRLTSIYSYKGAEVIQDLTYTKDYLGNLTRREDKRLNQVETFVYDNLNRVTQVDTTVAGSTNTVTMTYGITGNILTKSDVGTYTYGEVHASCGTSFARPHAVTTVSGTKNATYCYDANGNMTSGDGRTTTYTAFDKPTQITKGGNTVNFYYGPDRKRFKRIDNTVADGTKTTIYAAGKAYERITDANGVQEKHYVGDFAVITKSTANGGTLRTSYMHRDHLGSVDVLTDETGTVQQRMSFDTWGKRREINWQQMTEAAITTFDTGITTRGFTGHEQIDQVGLVHMNGRVYEPELGRFLSADPIVQAIDNLQSYNRYAYVQNNPLTNIDPSGFTLTGGDADTGWSSEINEAMGFGDGSDFGAIQGNEKSDNNNDGSNQLGNRNGNAHYTRNTENSFSVFEDANTHDFSYLRGSLPTPINRSTEGLPKTASLKVGVTFSKIAYKAYKAYKKTGKLTAKNLKDAGLDEIREIVDDLNSVFSTSAPLSERMLAAADLVSGLNLNNKALSKVKKAKKAPHTARYQLRDSKGRFKTTGKEKSGESEVEGPLSWPEQMKTHTERKILDKTKAKTKKGDTLTIQGEYAPCNHCKHHMNKAARERGIQVNYSWGNNNWQSK